MYETLIARAAAARHAAFVTVVACACATGIAGSGSVWAQGYQPPSLVFKLSGVSEKLELTTNTSRILTLDKNIPRVQVNNPDLLAVTPLSANQVQISAKKAGVTQVNLWDEDGQIHTLDILIYGDIAELEVALRTQFPNSSIKVYRYDKSLALKGFVDNPDYIAPIMRLVRNYAPDPEIINNITVGGVQQVLLKVKVMEISRRKLRAMGADWAYVSNSGGFAVQSVSQLLTRPANPGFGDFSPNDNGTFSFGIVNGNDAFFGFLQALQQNNVAKTLAEPNLVAVSGRPAQFNSGGEAPYVSSSNQGQIEVGWKDFGTKIDFLPIVLGNGNIRLEVRPKISNVDPSLAIEVVGASIPGFRARWADTAVEMKAGQTFAIAGLVEERTESVNRGFPYLSDVPVIGVPFRRMRDQVDEIELLILVTPEFVDAMDQHEAPCGGPGWATTSPSNRDLYCGGHVEVPAHCNPISGMQACGNDCCTAGYHQGYGGPAGSVVTDGMPLPGGTGYDDSYVPEPMHRPTPDIEMEPDAMTLPGSEPLPLGPSTQRQGPLPGPTQAVRSSAGQSQLTAPRPYSPQRQPVFVRNASRPDNPYGPSDAAAAPDQQSGLIGPIGYDAQ